MHYIMFSNLIIFISVLSFMARAKFNHDGQLQTASWLQQFLLKLKNVLQYAWSNVNVLCGSLIITVTHKRGNTMHLQIIISEVKVKIKKSQHFQLAAEIVSRQ